MIQKTVVHPQAETSANQRFVVSAELTLRELVNRFSSPLCRHVFVLGEDSLIVGIADLHQAQRLVSVENEVERMRWERLPVVNIAEPLTTSRNDDSHEIGFRDFDRESTTMVRDDAGLAALIFDGQVFVNWNRVDGTVSQNHVDSVTSLPVRLAFNRRIHEELERSSRSEQALAVILIDLDHFKEVNDRFGHRAGDTVLRAVAAGLRDGIRSYDFAARFGGDEFAVICSGCAPDKIHLPLARLRDSHARRMNPMGDPPREVTLSIGAAVLRRVDPACSAEVVVEQADMCLYAAKRAGRNTAFAVELDPFGLPTVSPREIR